MSNIRSIQVEERIRTLILKHRGNVCLIAEDGDVPIEYVERILRKVKREKKNQDVNFHIGQTLAQYIMDGAEQRKAYLLEELRREFEKPEILVSTCHRSPVKEWMFGGDMHYECEVCGKDCRVILIDDRDKGLILKLLKQLRDEDESIVNFLGKLGFINKLMNGDFDQVTPRETKPIDSKQVGLDATLVENVDKMDPRTREALRKQLEQKISEPDV